MRLLVVGASGTPVCGVRQFAGRLEPALRDAGADVVTCWWDQAPAGERAAQRVGFRGFATEVRDAAAELRPDWVVLHYSVFLWGWRGVPRLVPALRRLLDSVGVPVAVVLHEYAVPFRWRDPRQAVQALCQRAALSRLLSGCHAGVVTTEERLAALRRDRRANGLHLAFLPVASPVAPAAGADVAAPGDGTVHLGVFGFGTPGYPAEVVTGAVGELLARGRDVDLTLVGWPGPGGPDGRRWSAAATAAGGGCARATRFTGVLDVDSLSPALTALDVVVFPDPGGPSSRKTTLAAALAHGRAVVAFDGSGRWQALVDEGAVVLAPADRRGLAAALEPLVGDASARDDQGRRARAFHDARQAPAVLARQLLAVLGAPAPATASSRRSTSDALDVHDEA